MVWILALPPDGHLLRKACQERSQASLKQTTVRPDHMWHRRADSVTSLLVPSRRRRS